MQRSARTHQDMLQVCCGICGIKKNPSQVRKITANVLMKTKKIPGYTDYNLNDDRYPKVVCQQHYSTVQERSSAKSPGEYKHKLPDKPPFFNKTQLPHAFTRSTPTGYKDDHTCFLCEQNKGGRP